METSQSADAGKLTFAFAGASNLESADAPHMHGLEIDFVDADHFTAVWTLAQAGESKPSRFNFERVK